MICQATPEDASQIGTILSDWIDETPWMPRIHSLDGDQAYMRGLVAKGWVEVARLTDKVVGFIVLNQGEIHALYVARTARGQGVGRALLNRAKQQAEKLCLWTFVANTGAQRFYLRAGFSEIGRSDGSGNDEGLPDIRFEWRRGDD